MFRMKRFAKLHKKLFGIGCGAFFIVISYAVTYNMPDYFNIEGWYSLFNNLSISYLAALVFYVLQVYIPKLDKSKRASVALKPLFSDLVMFIEISIDCCRKFVEIDEEGTISIKWSDPVKKNISFAKGKVTDGKITGRIPIIKTDKELREIKKIYEYKMSVIKNRTDFKDCDEYILSLISDLESSNFYNITIPELIIFEASFHKVNDLEDRIVALEDLKNKLKQYCEIDDEFAIREANEVELFALDQILHNDALKVKTGKEFIEKTFRSLYDEKLVELVPDEAERKRIIDDMYMQLIGADR